jgi:protein-S-isoprenylcysteine O-methyltransferase Ste14
MSSWVFGDNPPEWYSFFGHTMKTPKIKSFIGLLCLFLVMAALLFIPAGTVDYWQAWVFLALFFAWSIAVTGYLVHKDPQLLQRRMRGGPFAEKEAAQKIIMRLTSLGFIGLIVVPAFDHRYAWSHMSPYTALAGDMLVLLGYLVIFLVFRVNTFASATVELAPGQKVISTGLYGVIRHPMYFGGFLLLVGMPIALGSWWGILVLVAITPVLRWRLIDEERFLEKNLPGYPEYQKQVKYRLIPGIW